MAIKVDCENPFVSPGKKTCSGDSEMPKVAETLLALRSLDRRTCLLLTGVGGLGTFLGVLASGPLAKLIFPQKPTEVPKVRLPPLPAAFAKPYLARADQQCETAIDEHIKTLDDFFTASRKNSRAFAEVALGFGSKWRLIADKVPFIEGGKHEAYIREQFEELIFKPQQLEHAVKQVVDSYLAHIRSIEGTMLVDMRIDAADFPTSKLFAQLDQPRLRQEYDKGIATAIEKAGKDLQANVGTELVAQIAGQLLTQVAVRMGASAAILGAGAASAWATLGVGFVVGVMLDQLVSWLWDWFADPAGDLALLMDKKLEEINRLIVDGSENVQGLRQRLRQFARDRGIVRGEAIAMLLQPK